MKLNTVDRIVFSEIRKSRFICFFVSMKKRFPVTVFSDNRNTSLTILDTIELTVLKYKTNYAKILGEFTKGKKKALEDSVQTISSKAYNLKK